MISVNTYKYTWGGIRAIQPKHKHQEAIYHINEDYINMPKRKNFTSMEGYYATLFH